MSLVSQHFRLTEFNDDVLRLIHRHLMEVLTDKHLDRLWVPVCRNRLTQQVRLYDNTPSHSTGEAVLQHTVSLNRWACMTTHRHTQQVRLYDDTPSHSTGEAVWQHTVSLNRWACITTPSHSTGEPVWQHSVSLNRWGCMTTQRLTQQVSLYYNTPSHSTGEAVWQHTVSLNRWGCMTTLRLTQQVRLYDDTTSHSTGEAVWQHTISLRWESITWPANILHTRRKWVSWSLTSPFSTNMPISEINGQGWRVIPTQWSKASDILTSTLADFLFSSHPKKRDSEARLNYYTSAYNRGRQLSHCKTKVNQIWQKQACILN